MERHRVTKSDKMEVESQRLPRSPAPLHPHPAHQLQQSLGNRALGRFIQAKRNVSQPLDQCEEEAGFGLGQHAPVTLAGERLVQRTPLPTGTNLRFDTYQVTKDDLNDPDIIARFEALSADGVRAYRERVSDAQVVAYLNHLLAARIAAAADAARVEYLLKVQEAVQQMADTAIAERTLSDVLFPLLKQLSADSRVAWKNEAGVVEVHGKPFKFKPPGKGAKKVELKLVLDEADPKKERRGGYFSASDGQIVLMVRNRPTVDGIRETLFHEGLHLASEVLRSQSAAALGDKKDQAVMALETALNKTQLKETLKKNLTPLHVSLNAARAQRKAPAFPEARVGETSEGLWEEIAVRAETFYFEWLHWMDKRTGSLPVPKYFDTSQLKETYLPANQFLDLTDLPGLTSQDEQLISLISSFLVHNTRSLIKARGVPNAYLPSPMEPKAPVFVLPTLDVNPGTIIKLEDLEPDFLNKAKAGIDKSLNEPPF